VRECGGGSVCLGCGCLFVGGGSGACMRACVRTCACVGGGLGSVGKGRGECLNACVFFFCIVCCDLFSCVGVPLEPPFGGTQVIEGPLHV